MVGLSFVQKPGDVRQLHEQLRRWGLEGMGVVLKIETRQGFENLPALILAVMATRVGAPSASCLTRVPASPMPFGR